MLVLGGEREDGRIHLGRLKVAEEYEGYVDEWTLQEVEVRWYI